MSLRGQQIGHVAQQLLGQSYTPSIRAALSGQLNEVPALRCGQIPRPPTPEAGVWLAESVALAGHLSPNLNPTTWHFAEHPRPLIPHEINSPPLQPSSATVADCGISCCGPAMQRNQQSKGSQMRRATQVEASRSPQSLTTSGSRSTLSEVPDTQAAWRTTHRNQPHTQSPALSLPPSSP